MVFTEADQQFMALALAQASEGRFWTKPNPSVGCVLVRDGAVIGQGYTQPAGGNHAEIQALVAAGDARGATAYVTLEPCAHHGRTGPCAEALVAAGVTRVIAAIEDPFPKVAGGGFAKLRSAGVEVDVGLLAEQAERQLSGFLLRMRRGWGRVRLKLGASLDGRTAMASGESQWITGPAARADVQLLRAESCAILTGSGTVLADDSRLTVRADQLPLADAALARAHQVPPLRVVLDSQGRVPATAAVFNTEGPSVRLMAEDLAGNVEGVVMPRASDGKGLDLAAVMRWLGEAKHCNEILVEAGSTLSAALLSAGLVDELVLYLAPKLLGADGRPLVALHPGRLADAPELMFKEFTPIGDDLRIIAEPK